MKSLGFLVEGARTNWFGFGCPAFCVQPSFSTIILASLLGFLAGIAFTFWAFWTFHGFGFSFGGPVPSASPSRYSVLAEYLNEHSSSNWKPSKHPETTTREVHSHEAPYWYRRVGAVVLRYSYVNEYVQLS